MDSLYEQDEEFIAAVESRKAVEAAAPAAAAAKGAKKGAPPPAAAGDAQPRIADEDMIELCKLALAKPDCQNLGAFPPGVWAWRDGALSM